MFSRNRFVKVFMILGLITLAGVVNARCQPVGGPQVVALLSSEEIESLGCDSTARTNEITACLVNAAGCDPQHPGIQVRECMAQVLVDIGCLMEELQPGMDAGQAPRHIAACAVAYFQN